MSIIDLSRHNILSELKPYAKIGVIGLGYGEDLEFFAKTRKRKQFIGFGLSDLSIVRKRTQELQNVQLVKYNGAHLPVKYDSLEALLVSEELQSHRMERRLEDGVYKVFDFLPQKILHAHRHIRREGIILFYGSLIFVENAERAVYNPDVYSMELDKETKKQHFSSAYSYVIFRRKKENLEEPNNYSETL